MPCLFFLHSAIFCWHIGFVTLLGILQVGGTVAGGCLWVPVILSGLRAATLSNPCNFCFGRITAWLLVSTDYHWKGFHTTRLILAKLSLETGPVPSPDNPHEASFLHCGLRGEGVISATGDGGVGNSLPTKQHGGKPLEDFGLKCGNATTLQIRKRRFRRAYRRLRVHGVTWYRGHFWQQQVAQPIPCDF